MELPKDGQLIALILKSFDVTECEPQVIAQLLEFIYRHVTETLQDSAQFAEHAGRPLSVAANTSTTTGLTNASSATSSTPSGSAITLNDVRFAIQSRASHYFRMPPSRELMLEIATTKNSVALPVPSPDSYFRLPPESTCLYGQQSTPASVSSATSTTASGTLKGLD